MSGWGAVIATIASAAYGGYSANKARQRAKDEAKKAQARQDELMKMFLPYGKDMLGRGKENMGLVESYWRPQLSGDRGRTMQAVAPEINAMTDQARGSVSAARMGAPRGGASAAAGADIPRQLQSGVNNLLFSVRPQAAQNLAQLGGNQSSLGLGALGQGAGLTNSMLQYGLDSRQLAMQQGQALGQGLSGLTQLMQYYANNRSSPQTAALNPRSPQTQSQYPNLFGDIWTGRGGSSPTSPLGGTRQPSNYNIYSPPGGKN